MTSSSEIIYFPDANETKNIADEASHQNYILMLKNIKNIIDEKSRYGIYNVRVTVSGTLRYDIVKYLQGKKYKVVILNSNFSPVDGEEQVDDDGEIIVKSYAGSDFYKTINISLGITMLIGISWDGR